MKLSGAPNGMSGSRFRGLELGDEPGEVSHDPGMQVGGVDGFAFFWVG